MAIALLGGTAPEAAGVALAMILFRWTTRAMRYLPLLAVSGINDSTQVAARHPSEADHPCLS